MPLTHRIITGVFDYKQYKERDRRTKLLFKVIADKNAYVVKHLLAKGVDLNSRTPRGGRTLLHVTVRDGNSEIMLLLLKAGCSIDTLDYGGSTPLITAICNNKTSMIRSLITAGADIYIPDSVSGTTPLHFSVQDDANEATLDLLLKHGADVAARDHSNQTPLMYAVDSDNNDSHANIIKSLLEAGSDVNSCDNQGVTPFHQALVHCSLDTVKRFLHHGADVAIIDFHGSSALHYAACGDSSVLSFILGLLEGIDVDQRNNDGKSALHYAAMFGKRKSIVQLLDLGADIKAVDNQGNTMFFYGMSPSSAKIKIQILRLLLNLGADYRFLDFYAYDIRRIAGNTALANVIFELLAELFVSQSKVKRQVLNEEEPVMLAIFPEHKAYYERCQSELRAMQERQVGKTTVSFFRLMTDDLDMVARYARNRQLVKAFKDSDYKTSFPIYQAALKAKLAEGLKRHKLVERASMVLSDTLQFTDDPRYPAFEIILGYLDRKDIFKLVKIL